MLLTAMNARGLDANTGAVGVFRITALNGIPKINQQGGKGNTYFVARNMNFDQLFGAFEWKPIANCPGRFVLRNAPANLTFCDLIGEGVAVIEFRVESARDIVLVARFKGGGLISYRREDGSCLHTLNTDEGLRRKLAQLGIYSE